MKLNFTKEQTIKVIQAYYKMYENRDVEVVIKASKGCEGIYETPCANIKIMVNSKVSVLGEQILTEGAIDKKEITNIFTTILNEEGYSVENIYYDAGLTTEDDRYNHSYPTAYFNGIHVEAKSMVKQKINILGLNS